MGPITVLGVAAAVFTTGATLPQVIKALRTKRTHDISLMMYLMMLTGLILWLIYGIALRDIPLIFANTTGLALTGIMIFCKFRYG